MKAEKVRQRLSNIQESYPGHMQAMLRELDELEREAKFGRALLWAVQTMMSVTNYYGDEIYLDQGDLDELMNAYEGNGVE